MFAISMTGIPKGTIAVWSGSIATIPSGWVLCNGSNGTPDMRNVFPAGAQEDVGGVAKTNLTGVLSVSGGSITPIMNYDDNSFALDGELALTAIWPQPSPQPYRATVYIMKL